ncbi:MAG: DUF5662 family protein [Peptococcaceae bacterium]|nr:DUF5662 family protein [Peptococcaceae bacterium]
MFHPIKHFLVVHRHRKLVFRHCRMAGIPLQGLLHDLSKYSPQEFIPGAHYYLGYKSPNVREREVKGYSAAWMHHKGRNKHHFEYWVDYQIASRRSGPVKMPDRYVIEMFCDRVAASKVYQGDNYTDQKPLEYFETGFAKNFMHPETARVLETWLKMLARDGEVKTFAYIRANRKHVYKRQ